MLPGPRETGINESIVRAVRRKGYRVQYAFDLRVLCIRKIAVGVHPDNQQIQQRLFLLIVESGQVHRSWLWFHQDDLVSLPASSLPIALRSAGTCWSKVSNLMPVKLSIT